MTEKQSIKEAFTYFCEHNGDCGYEISDSGITQEELLVLEENLGIELPEEYRNFVSTCAYNFTEMAGILDNFLFMDDVEVTLELPALAPGKELENLEEHLIGNRFIIGLGYIPIGIFDDNGYLYIDTRKENKIVWLPYENCVGFTTYEEFDDEHIVIFNDFAQFLRCFFYQERHELEG